MHGTGLVVVAAVAKSINARVRHVDITADFLLEFFFDDGINVLCHLVCHAPVPLRVRTRNGGVCRCYHQRFDLHVVGDYRGVSTEDILLRMARG